MKYSFVDTPNMRPANSQRLLRATNKHISFRSSPNPPCSMTFPDGENAQLVTYKSGHSGIAKRCFKVLKSYTNEELGVLLQNAGFKIEAIFGDMTQKEPLDTEERLFYICRKF